MLARKSFLVSWNACRERTVLRQTGLRQRDLDSKGRCEGSFLKRPLPLGLLPALGVGGQPSDVAGYQNGMGRVRSSGGAQSVFSEKCTDAGRQMVATAASKARGVGGRLAVAARCGSHLWVTPNLAQ
jgi:hypothetical protein